MFNVTTIAQRLQLEYADDYGLMRHQDIDLARFRTGAGLTLPATGAGIVGVGAIATNLSGIVWDAAADAGDTIRLPWTVPSDYRQDTGKQGDRSAIILALRMRKIDTGANPDNATLSMDTMAYWQNPAYAAPATPGTPPTFMGNSATIRARQAYQYGIPEIDGSTAVQALGAVIPKVLTDETSIADVADSAVEKFRWIHYWITGEPQPNATLGMTAAQRLALQPGAKMDLVVAPSATVGTGLNVQLLQARILYTGHLTIREKLLRSLARW